MIIGERIKEARIEKNLSQGDIEHRTGLLRCYLSRVENGHTVPSLETLEKISRAMGIPLAEFFSNPGTKTPTRKWNDRPVPAPEKDKTNRNIIRLLHKISARDRRTLLKFAGALARGR